MLYTCACRGFDASTLRAIGRMAVADQSLKLLVGQPDGRVDIKIDAEALQLLVALLRQLGERLGARSAHAVLLQEQGPRAAREDRLDRALELRAVDEVRAPRGDLSRGAGGATRLDCGKSRVAVQSQTKNADACRAIVNEYRYLPSSSA